MYARLFLIPVFLFLFTVLSGCRTQAASESPDIAVDGGGGGKIAYGSERDGNPEKIHLDDTTTWRHFASLSGMILIYINT